MRVRQKTQFSRFIRHIKKKVRTTVHGYRPEGIYGRFIAPRILLNSIPKSGTHLLEHTLEQFPLLRNAGRRTIHSWDSIAPDFLQCVRTIRRGEFLNAHLTALQEVFDVIDENNIKVLFMIRDPRDVAVSYYKYVTAIDGTHDAHRYFASLPSEEDRLLAAIEKMEGEVTIGEVLRRFQPWLELDDVLVCRFEDIIGPKGGGDREQQLKLLRSIGEYLDISISDARLNRIADGVFSSRSSTFREGKAGGWKNYFNTKHIAVFKEVAGEELISYGYEHDLNW